MSNQFFVQKLAYLEGYCRRAPTSKPIFDVTIDNTDARLIRLENTSRIHSPPPMLSSTWESLEFRARRLPTPMGSREINIVEGDAPNDVQMDTLKRVLFRLDSCFLTFFYEEKVFDLSIIAQHVCYVAGQSRCVVIAPIKDINQLYAVALELCLKVEGQPRGPPPPPSNVFPMSRPFNPRIIGATPGPSCTKTRGGCCSCRCHNGKAKNAKSKGVWNFLKFGWLRNPFRKHDDRSDAESVTSSSSEETIV